MSSLALSLRVYEFWLVQYRRAWRGTVITSVINPVFYLGALGVGLGSIVNKSGGQPLGVPYLDFVAPGLLAAAAMQMAQASAKQAATPAAMERLMCFSLDCRCPEQDGQARVTASHCLSCVLRTSRNPILTLLLRKYLMRIGQ